MGDAFIIGVDGGGTHSRALLTDLFGEARAVFDGGSLNYNNIGIDAARENLRNIVDGAMAAAGADDYENLVVGLSALDSAADFAAKARFADGAFDVGRLDLQSDAHVALIGATKGGAGMIVICGTGSMLLLTDGRGLERVSGGWGRVFDDACSSYEIAVQGLTAAIDAWEGTGERTLLCDRALAHFGIAHGRALIDRVYGENSGAGFIAGFAKEVLALVREDAAAKNIVDRNVEKLSRQALALISDTGVKTVGLYGGVFQHNEYVVNRFKELLLRRESSLVIGFPEFPPEAGAVIHALKARGRLTDAALQNLKRSTARLYEGR